MTSGELSDAAEAQRETFGKTQILHSRPEPLQIIAESSHHPERILSRSPTLSSLPENGVSSLVSAQINSTDFVRPGRQYTDSTTSTSENSFGLNSNRSSIAPQLSQPLILHLNSSEQQLQAAKATIQRESALFEALRCELGTVPSPHQNRSPRMPVDGDLKDIRELQEGISWKIGLYGQGASEDAVNNVIVVLHDYGGDHSSVKPMVKKHFADPQTALLCLGGIHRLRPVSGQVGGLYWTDEPNGNSYHRAVRLILEHVIGKVLVEKCNFSPSNIALLGHGQGGSVALATAAVWETTRLGGVITIDGPPPEYISPSPTPRILTPVLMIGGRLGALTPQAEQRAKDLFLHVDVDLRPGVEVLSLAQLLDSTADSEEIKTAKDFLAHSLRQEEWETQTILTFDGGGIRGYGSLLILKELMRRIGLEERRIDSRAESSFYPGVYKPRAADAASDGRPGTASSHPQDIVGTPTTDAEGKNILDESDLYLPCHYFNYLGGTSTGGLISIMLSRFRMTVNDCIDEYKILGGKVFAHPRPLATGGILWHKFHWKDLEDVIQSVTDRHCFHGQSFGLHFDMDPDFCRTVVLAYSEDGTTDAPYLFRTYPTFRRPAQPGQIRRPTTLALKGTPDRNPGPSSHDRIALVGRATSAAPTYFPPVRIRVPDVQKGGEKRVRFKDGGFGSNNPSLEIYNDVVRKHGGYSKNVGLFISVGTGYSELKMFETEGLTRAGTRVREFYANLRAARKMASRTQGAHDGMLGHAVRDNRIAFSYSRFEGGRELGKIDMDEWKSNRISNLVKGKQTVSGGMTLQNIETAVKIYLSDPKVQHELDDRARLLVRRRRLRMRDKSKWDRYASASWYECPFTCRDTSEHKTYTTFEEHVRKEHYQEYKSEGFDAIAKRSRKCWLYRAG